MNIIWKVYFVLYGVSLLGVFVIGLIKGNIHFEYQKTAGVKAYDGKSFFSAFSLFNWDIGVQLLLLPIFPRRSMATSPELLAEYKRVKLLSILLIVLWAILFSPALTALYFTATLS